MNFVFSLLPLIIVSIISTLLHIIDYSIDMDEKTERKKLHKQLKSIFEKYEINEYFQNEIMDIYNIKQSILNEFKEDIDISLEEEEDDEIVIWALYIKSLFENITGYYSFEKYNEENKAQIRKMYNLLFDKKYKHKDFLLKNMLSFNHSLKEPYNFLKGIEDLGMTTKQITKEHRYITSEVIEVLDIFLSIIDILYEKYEEYEDATETEENIVEDPLFSELNEYNELLMNIRKDIANRKVIFG